MASATRRLFPTRPPAHQLIRLAANSTAMTTLGSGPPLVMIPGLDGHWTWMRPAIEALARHFTVIPVAGYGERDAGTRTHAFDPASGFDAQTAQVDEALNEVGVERATICGTSYGGWIALSYAAWHRERTSALVLISAPPPGFVPNERQTRYLRAPMRSMPAFVLTSPQRVLPEVFAALPTWRDRVRFLTNHVSRVVRTGMSPARMAWRMRVTAGIDFFEACRRIEAPTLIVTGEPDLDKIVPVDQTQKYLSLIPGSKIVTLPNTGHMGSLTHAEAFADSVARFVARTRDQREGRRAG